MKISIGVSIGNNQPFGQSLDAAYKEVLLYADLNGITKPSNSVNVAYSNFLKDLEPNGLRADAETINIYGFGSKEFGTLNLVDPTTFRHEEIGGITYGAGRGIKSPSNGNAINTKYKNNQYAGAQNNLGFSIFVEESNITGIAERAFGASILAASAATRLQLSPFTTGTSGAKFLNHLNQQPFDSSNHRGLYTMWPNGGLSLISKDGAITTTSDTRVTPDLNNDQLLLSSNFSLVNGGISVETTYKKFVGGLFRIKNMTVAREEQLRNAWIRFLRAVRPVGNTWFVRPSGGSYGLENGTSYLNAFNGFADIDPTVLGIWDEVIAVGTFNETFTIPAPFVRYSGLYEGDTAIINGGGSRARCIYNFNRSYVTIEDFILQNPTSDCLGIYNGSWNVVVNRVIGSGSGNQAFQNETNVKVQYNDCQGTLCTDDGLSIHGGGIVEANRCRFNLNGQGANAIGNGILVSNDCDFEDNSVANIQSDINSDFTINGGNSINGNVIGNSSVALKLIGVSRVNSNTSGNVIIS